MPENPNPLTDAELAERGIFPPWDARALVCTTHIEIELYDRDGEQVNPGHENAFGVVVRIDLGDDNSTYLDKGSDKLKPILERIRFLMGLN